jgi:hypothetical protein
MALNERIIALTEQINDFMSKENPIGSEEFIKLALNVMNFDDLNSNLEELQKEERKEVEFDWMWKESIV